MENKAILMEHYTINEIEEILSDRSCDYRQVGIERLNDELPIYIKVCRNVGGINMYREYQRQIIGRSVRFVNAQTNDCCKFFGGDITKTLHDNLVSCYEWIYNINKVHRYENIYIAKDRGNMYVFYPYKDKK